jgi:thioredoxin 1
MASENIIVLSDSDFEEKVLKSDKPILVDFWADWCGPCKSVAPFLDDIADEMKGKVSIGKLNVDQNTTQAGNFGVRSIPTLILFQNGKETERIVGADTGKIRRVLEAI